MSETTIQSVALDKGILTITSIQKGNITSGTGEIPVDYKIVDTYIASFTNMEYKIILQSSTKTQI